VKRYRVLSHEFDYRSNWLTMEIQNEWEDHIKKMWRDGIRNVERGLLLEYGIEDADRKLQDFIDLGEKPVSILAYHNRFANQVRQSFVVGGYYPALVAACALGERILNHLVLDLRDYFKGTAEYKRSPARRNAAGLQCAFVGLLSYPPEPRFDRPSMPDHPLVAPKVESSLVSAGYRWCNPHKKANEEGVLGDHLSLVSS
jgi:hypothetical protein